jgi:hypothetical protein
MRAIYYITGTISIAERQQATLAIVMAKVWENPDQGLHYLIAKYKVECTSTTNNTRTLRPGQPRISPTCRLKRECRLLYGGL